MEDLALTRATDRHMSASLGAGERHALEVAHVTEEIKAAFAAIGVLPLKAIALPKVSQSYIRSGVSVGWRESSVNMEDAIESIIDRQAVLDELMHVISESKCEHVANLRRVLEETYIDDWASEVADHRCEE